MILKRYTFIFLLIPLFANTQHISVVGEGFAGNIINTAVFRKNSVVSFNDVQYVAYYDTSAHVILAKRKLGTDNWEIKQTKYTGNIKDAHNSISIMVDGDGYLHMAWDHHNSSLKYCRSLKPGSLEMSEPMSMTGENESKITYPEFYHIEDGLLFLYRDGTSGNGNLIMNRYFTQGKFWTRVQTNLIDGEGRRNAYWQACTDKNDVIHLSWVWRESPDVASNHDVCYARSDDGGKTWKRSDNSNYTLPINAANAEYAVRIPQNSELINQTSMCVNAAGHPYIATYWKPADTNIPQYHIIYHDGKNWITSQISQRKAPFSLSGVGTKLIPIARPQVLVDGNTVYCITRDENLGNHVKIFTGKQSKDVYMENMHQWEPSYDTELWRTKKQLHIFLQTALQGDGEKTITTKPQPIKICEVSLQ